MYVLFMKRLLSFILALVSSGIVATAFSTNVSPIEVQATSNQTIDYAFSGQLDTFTVPNGVSSLVVSLSGAEGGQANVNGAGSPGKGGFLSVSVAVTPGEIFKIRVGQHGESFGVGVTPNTPMAGGWPNGGDGYISPQGGNNGIGTGAGGGGATALYKVINNTDTLVAIAGGGGGAGGMTSGGGGGVAGENTFSVVIPLDITREASGGTQNNGGVGACVDEDGNSTSDVCNGDGASLSGGDAGVNNYGGGGGGGGYFGGGAGMGHGGGAGGSTWWNSTHVTRTNDQTGVRQGNGVLSVTYTQANPCVPGRYSATGFEPCTPAALGYFVNISGSTSQTACQTGFTTFSVGSIQCEPIATTSTNPPQSPAPTVVPVVSESPTTTVTPLKVCTTTSGRSISRACLATNAKIIIPSSSRISFTVAKSSARVCRATGSTLRATKKGSCSVTMKVTPKKGKAKSYRVTVSVTK